MSWITARKDSFGPLMMSLREPRAQHTSQGLMKNGLHLSLSFPYLPLENFAGHDQICLFFWKF